MNTSNAAAKTAANKVMASTPKLVSCNDLPPGKRAVPNKLQSPVKVVSASSTTDSDFDDIAGPTLGSKRKGHVEINLSVLLRTRMLITASSGGGKSYAMRRLVEQTAPLVQQIIIDPEGEFETLTEKYPFAVFNNRSKVPLCDCSPYALAQELVRKEVSAVVDISEFETEERQRFLARFIQGLLKLEQESWRPVMVFVDEIHLFAPQWGKAESKSHVSDLACRGRKRGYCLVGATNRLSLLYKSVASELQNRLIGQTGLDVDIKRAADELGMGKPQAVSTLSNLEPGNFMVFGPALSKIVERVVIGPVQTTHGIPLGEIKGPTTPTDAVMAEIFKLTENAKSAAADGAVQTELQSHKTDDSGKREEARTQIAEQRLKILAPILALGDDSPDRGAAITRAVEQSGVIRQTIYNWLNSYDPADPIASLAPMRIPRDFVLTEKKKHLRKKVIRLQGKERQ